MSESTCNCCEKITAVMGVVWEQIKTLSMLMERIEKEGDRLQELYRAAEQERQQAQAVIWEKHLRDKIAEADKNGR